MYGGNISKANSNGLACFVLLQYDKLNRVVKDFEPYRNLWVTASDWMKWYEGWMTDPLVAIDAEAVEKNVNDSYKLMHKLVRLFQESPGMSFTLFLKIYLQ